MPWIYTEDGALKSKLQGLTVSDANDSALPVAVRFRLPEVEVANVTYPLIVIEHSNMSPAHDREHRGYIQLPYAPEGQTPWWADDATSIDPTQSPFWSDYPIPMNLDYQITLFARKALHGLTLIPKLATVPYLPPRFGYLKVDTDNTVRSLDLLGGPEPSDALDAEGKRLFAWTYLVRIYTEVFWSQISTFTKVTNVEIDLTPFSDTYEIP